MKKKITKKKKPVKQKIDVVLESLLNLETVVKELIKKVESLQYRIPYYPPYQPPQDNNEPFKKYWPNANDPPIMWNNENIPCSTKKFRDRS